MAEKCQPFRIILARSGPFKTRSTTGPARLNSVAHPSRWKDFNYSFTAFIAILGIYIAIGVCNSLSSTLSPRLSGHQVRTLLLVSRNPSYRSSMLTSAQLVPADLCPHQRCTASARERPATRDHGNFLAPRCLRMPCPGCVSTTWANLPFLRRRHADEKRCTSFKILFAFLSTCFSHRTRPCEEYRHSRSALSLPGWIASSWRRLNKEVSAGRLVYFGAILGPTVYGHWELQLGHRL